MKKKPRHIIPTKTIRYRERQLELPLLLLEDGPLPGVPDNERSISHPTYDMKMRRFPDPPAGGEEGNGETPLDTPGRGITPTQ
jgi:hypothetical protein